MLTQVRTLLSSLACAGAARFDALCRPLAVVTAVCLLGSACSEPDAALPRDGQDVGPAGSDDGDDEQPNDDDNDDSDAPALPRADGGTVKPGQTPPPSGKDGGGATAPVSEAGAAVPDSGAVEPPPVAAGDLSVFKDPGAEAWKPVPEAEVAEKCKLDPAKLKGLSIGSGYAVVRYGQLCHDSSGGRDTASQMYSATKTLGALVTGIASYETRDIPRTGPKTGQLKDSDKATYWLSSVSYNQEATLAHVLAMVGHNRDLSYGKKVHAYDTVGSVQINTAGTMVSTAIKQDSARLGTATGAFAEKFLFDVTGMKSSSWGGTGYATSWSSTMGDMARLGLLIIHQGVWSGKRVLDSGWTYKMTHPAFEDGNTAYGYLTWLVAKEGQRSIGGGSFTSGGGDAGGLLADTCSPSAVWQKYPHGLSEAPDCTYKNSPCAQKFDVGSWSAQGLGGQFIVGHPGLDLVLVAKNYSGGGGPRGIWDAIRPALIALDPTYKGDDAAFCKAYAAGDYAPDLPAPVVQPAD